ncbi:hypothetical protein YA0002_25345 [Pseudomonas cichorii]|uniref:Uncharacterized protein n=1 Tax=Pseudomonas serbiensis TaxID=3064350 RepID=A0ABT9CQJ2_9PSED|nr:MULTISPECIES: hypothetical protein [Pseudomonas]MBI6856092.1 hypothetical protein [Pseudomonas cichorii]MDO7927758.1 hypothetical protein [Pseudomonas sp. KFB-138]
MTMVTFKSTTQLVRRSVVATWSFSWPFLMALVLAITLIWVVKAVFGDFEKLKAWQESHYGYLLAWRLLIYVLIGFGWLRLCSRLMKASDGEQARPPIRRCEVMAIAMVLMFEISHSGLLGSSS